MTSGNGTKVHDVIHCNCTPPWPLAPAGYCDRCGFEGPVRRVVMDDIQTQGSRSILSVMTDTVTSKYKKVDWHDAFRSQPDEVNWLFEPILEAGTVNALFGRPGLGKSLITLEMAAYLARWGKRVLYLDNENRLADTVERLRAFNVSPHELDNLIMYSFSDIPPLDTHEGGQHLAALADENEPDLVVVDTATRFVEGEENSASTWLQLYRCSMVPLKSRGIAVLRIDHPGKDDSKGQRGSSAKAGDVDSVWWLRTDEREDLLILERLKSRSDHGEPVVTVKRLHNPLRHDWDAIETLPVTPKIRALSDWFDGQGIAREVGRPKLRTVLDSTKGSPTCSTTELSLVARYRKSLFREQQNGGEDVQQMQDGEEPLGFYS